MAKIIPFKAVLPTRDKVHLVASRSYINYTKPHLKGKLESNPFSFLHIINPDFYLPKKVTRHNIKYDMVKEKYLDFLNRGYFYKKEEIGFYLYRQIKNGKSYTGIIAGASVNDYLSGKIKIHEHTLTKREKLFEAYLEHTGFNAEPVLMTHPHSDKLISIKEKITESRPEFDFSTTDYVQHQFWIIDKPQDIKAITKEFLKFNSLYIADGHHRSASSVLLAKDYGELQNDSLGINFFMSLFIDEDELNILPFNRLLSSIKPFSEYEFIEKVKEQFNEVIAIEGEFIGPTKHHEIGMYINNNWFLLKSKISEEAEKHPTKRLDPQILSDKVFENILGIIDIKKDKRVRFVSGTDGVKSIEKQVNKGLAKVGFALHGLNIKDVKLVADANMVMPPKSTWIEPKLRSGLVIYEF